MYLLNNVFTNEHGEAITVLQLLTKFKNVLSEIDTYLNEYGNRLNSIEFKNVTQQQEIDILKSQVQTLQTNVNNLQLTVGDYLLRFNDLDIQISVINGKIDSNTTDITSLNTSVSNIQTSITNINNQISTINNQISGINTRIDIALSSISNLNEDVSTINNTLSTHTNTINTLNTNVNELTTLVNNLQNTCTTLTNDLNELTSRISYLETNDTWQNEQISSLTTTSQLNTNNISALNTLLGNLDSRIDLLEVANNTIFNTFICDADDTLPPTREVSPSTLINLFDFPSTLGEKGCIKCDFSCNLLRNASGDLSFNFPSGAKTLTIPAGTNTTQVHIEIIFDYKVQSYSINPRIWYWGIIKITYDEKTIIKNIGTSNAYPHAETQPFPYVNDKCSFSFGNVLRIADNFKISKYIYV